MDLPGPLVPQGWVLSTPASFCPNLQVLVSCGMFDMAGWELPWNSMELEKGEIHGKILHFYGGFSWIFDV